MSLIEQLLALSIVGTVTAILVILLVSALQSQDVSARQDDLALMASLAMERMVRHVRQANRVLIPMANNPTRSVLALGGFVDNDGDGLYDEDPGADITADGAAGIVGIDDDGDGLVDEDPPDCGDDDGDGQCNEDPIEPIVYYLNTATKTLWERYPVNATTRVTTALAEHVVVFQVQRLLGANGAVLIDIRLRLQNEKGHVVELQTRVFPRLLQQ